VSSKEGSQVIRQRIQIALSLALGIGALGFQLPLGATIAHACGTYVDGVCVVPPDPVIVDDGTGPVMVDGLVEKLDLVVNDAEGLVSSTLTDTAGVTTPTSPTTFTESDLDLGVVAANAPHNNDGHNYGSCYSQDSCNNLQLYEPTYNGYFNPSGDFKADGVAQWSELVPSDSQPQEFWVWDEHSLLTSKGSNLCILTNSAELSGKGTSLETEWPGGSVYENSNTTLNMGLSWSGVSLGGSFTLYKGEMLGEVYNSGTGFVASWREQNGNCAPYNDSIELKNGVIWGEDWNDAPNSSWRVETAVWYQD
jgi:hypothetical protein